MAQLGKFVNIKTGKLDANAAVSGGQYPFFTCSRNTLEIDNYAFDGNAVLVAGNGDLNVKHYDGKFNAYQRTDVIIVNDPNNLDTRYLYHWMSKYVDRLRELSIGGVIKYVSIHRQSRGLYDCWPLKGAYSQSLTTKTTVHPSLVVLPHRDQTWFETMDNLAAPKHSSGIVKRQESPSRAGGLLILN